MTDAPDVDDVMAAVNKELICSSDCEYGTDEAHADGHRNEIERVAVRAAVRYRAEMPCYEQWGDHEIRTDMENCERQIADMIRREQELDIKYHDRDRRCPSCKARAALETMAQEAVK